MTQAAVYPSRVKAWSMIALLFLASIVSVLDRTALNIVIDPVKADLRLTDVQLSLLQGLAFGLFYATVGIPLGLAADRYSRKRLIIFGIAVWSLATIAGGLAQGFGWLFASRLLVGLGEASLGPAGISLIADAFPPHRRGAPISITLAGQSVAGGLSISVTSFILAAAGRGLFAGVPVLGHLAAWRIAFIGCGLLGFLVAGAFCFTREPPRHGPGPSVQLDERIGPKFGYFQRNLAIFAPLYLGFAICFLAVYGSTAWSPTMLRRGFSATDMQLGAWLGPATSGFAVVGPLIAGTLVDRFEGAGRPLAKFVMLSLAPLLIIPSVLATFAPSLGPAVLLVASGATFTAVVGTTTFASLQSIVPPNMRGLAIALTGLINTLLGAATGPFLIAVMTEHVYRNPALVGRSIATVATPALLIASVLLGLAGLAVARRSRTKEAVGRRALG